jgi:hypothetical protein
VPRAQVRGQVSAGRSEVARRTTACGVGYAVLPHALSTNAHSADSDFPSQARTAAAPRSPGPRSPSAAAAPASGRRLPRSLLTRSAPAAPKRTVADQLNQMADTGLGLENASPHVRPPPRPLHHRRNRPVRHRRAKGRDRAARRRWTVPTARGSSLRSRARIGGSGGLGQTITPASNRDGRKRSDPGRKRARPEMGVALFNCRHHVMPRRPLMIPGPAFGVTSVRDIVGELVRVLVRRIA